MLPNRQADRNRGTTGFAQPRAAPKQRDETGNVLKDKAFRFQVVDNSDKRLVETIALVVFGAVPRERKALTRRPAHNEIDEAATQETDVLRRTRLDVGDDSLPDMVRVEGTNRGGVEVDAENRLETGLVQSTGETACTAEQIETAQRPLLIKSIACMSGRKQRFTRRHFS